MSNVTTPSKFVSLVLVVGQSLLDNLLLVHYVVSCAKVKEDKKNEPKLSQITSKKSKQPTLKNIPRHQNLLPTNEYSMV